MALAGNLSEARSKGYDCSVDQDRYGRGENHQPNKAALLIARVRMDNVREHIQSKKIEERESEYDRAGYMKSSGRDNKADERCDHQQCCHSSPTLEKRPAGHELVEEKQLPKEASHNVLNSFE